MTHLLERTLLSGVLGLMIALTGVVIVASSEQNTCRFSAQFFHGMHAVADGQKNHIKQITDVVSKVLDKIKNSPDSNWSSEFEIIMSFLDKDIVALTDQRRDRLRVPFTVFLCLVKNSVKKALAELRNSIESSANTESENIGKGVTPDSERHSDVVEDIRNLLKLNVTTPTMFSHAETPSTFHIKAVNMTAMQKICQMGKEAQAPSSQVEDGNEHGIAFNISSLWEACRSDEEKKMQKPIFFLMLDAQLSELEPTFRIASRIYVQENANVDFTLDSKIESLNKALKSTHRSLQKVLKQYILNTANYSMDSMDLLVITSIREIYRHVDEAAQKVKDTVADLTSLQKSTEHNNHSGKSPRHSKRRRSNANQSTSPSAEEVITFLNSILTVWNTSKPKDPAEQENPVEQCISFFEKLKTHLNHVEPQNVSLKTKDCMIKILGDFIIRMLFKFFLLNEKIRNFDIFGDWDFEFPDLDFDLSEILDKAKPFIIVLFLIVVAVLTIVIICCFSRSIGDVRVYGHRVFLCRTCGHVRDEELAALSAGVPVGVGGNASQGISPVQQICVVPNEVESVVSAGWQKQPKQDEYSMKMIRQPSTPKSNHETEGHSSHSKDHPYTHPSTDDQEEEEEDVNSHSHDPPASVMSATPEEKRILEETPPPTPSPESLPPWQLFTSSKESSN